MIFIDRSVPRGVAIALQAVKKAGEICWLEDRYPHDTKDEVWLPDAGAQSWLVVVRDKHIMTRPAERDAVMNHNVGMFVFSQSKDPTKWGYLKLFALCLDEMERLFEVTERPFIFRIDSAGNIRQVEFCLDSLPSERLSSLRRPAGFALHDRRRHERNAARHPRLPVTVPLRRLPRRSRRLTPRAPSAPPPVLSPGQRPSPADRPSSNGRFGPRGR